MRPPDGALVCSPGAVTKPCMSEREQILASVEGSHRLERLPVSAEMSDLLARWSRGEVTDEDLQIAERRLLAGERLAGPVAAAPTGARAA